MLLTKMKYYSTNIDFCWNQCYNIVNKIEEVKFMAKYCPYVNRDVVYLQCQECDCKICENDWFYCLVVGSRNFNNYSMMNAYLNKVLSAHSKIVIISGGANGADSLAEQYANEHNYPLIVMKADWDKYGKSAGYIRNQQMHDFIAKHSKRGCVAFWDGKSKGTAHNFPICEKMKTPLRIYRFDK